MNVEARGRHVRLKAREVLTGLDLRAQAGEVTAIVGPNGAGKTTLLRALGALMPLESGRVCWRGQEIGRERGAFHLELAYLGFDAGGAELAFVRRQA